MKILAIESSCDDTSVALLKIDQGIFEIISEKTASQIDIHQKYGGVVPEVAGRAHAENIMPVIEEVMKNQEKPDIIAATTGPGLITGLLVGTEAAKALSYLWDIPFISINHIEGHIHSVLLDNQKIEFPAIALIVSGGHTELILMKNHGQYELIGKTTDDAAGEAFDKVAKLLGLDYPGGPKISKHAENGNANAIPFPRPMLDKKNFDFSFSGLKTSALYWLRDNKLATLRTNPLGKISTWFGQSNQNQITIDDFCASFEQAIVDVLVKKTFRAAKKYQPKTIIVAGGVSANKKLRKTLKSALDIPVLYPEPKYCMDNAAMIGAAAYFKASKKEFNDWKAVKANPNWKVYE